MPYAEVNGTRLHYTDTGSGDVAIVFSHGLLFSTEMLEDQVAHFKDKYDMDTLTDDAAALIKSLVVTGCHFVGLSMGGFVALRMALNYPDLVGSIAVLDSSADPEPQENRGKYKFLNFVLRWFGSKPVVKSVMPIMFSQTFLNDPARKALRDRWATFLGKVPNRKGMAKAVSGVIERQGVYERLGEITTPTLIVVGDEDTATVPAKSERMHAAIKGSEFVMVPQGGHVSTIDAPDAINVTLSKFFEKLDG